MLSSGLLKVGNCTFCKGFKVLCNRWPVLSLAFLSCMKFRKVQLLQTLFTQLVCTFHWKGSCRLCVPCRSYGPVTTVAYPLIPLVNSHCAFEVVDPIVPTSFSCKRLWNNKRSRCDLDYTCDSELLERESSVHSERSCRLCQCNVANLVSKDLRLMVEYR